MQSERYEEGMKTVGGGMRGLSHAEKFCKLKLRTGVLIIIIQMSKVGLLIGLTLLAAFASAVPPCPLQLQIGSVISARVIVAQQKSLVSLSQGTDTQCYNYSLPYSFGSVPSVAVAIHDFESKPSQDLFFSIKPLQTESLAYVPFLIRTQWRYTAWTKIGFSFLAEDRKDLEAGYYQVDTGALGGCEPGKTIQVLLPFGDMGHQPGNINHKLFLHGFQISVQKYNATSLSPFEIQLADSSANISGIAVLISVTTVTQVQALHISYLAWRTTNLQLVVGSYVYEMAAPYDIVHTPASNIGRNYARLHGLTGFIINYNSQALTFTTTWSGSKFIFDLGVSQRLTQYFSFNYIFFIGSECSDCTGYVFTHNGQCVSSCPMGSYPTIEKTCIECGDGYFWDGSQCQKLCPEGQYLNIATNQCECPAGLNWTGKICLSCTSGKIFRNDTKTCECPDGTRWNGFGCAKADPCTDGKQWDVFTFTCKCPIGTTWNGTYCFKPNTCKGGQYLDATFKCVCPDGTYFKDGYCQNTGCTGGQIFNGTACICETGYNWNGSLCLLCINGQVWNKNTKTCSCETGYLWNGNFCEKTMICSGGRVYNKQYEQCLCPDKNFWNGAACMPKPDCCCGKRWNDKTMVCECPEGFSYDGRTCVLCTSGKVFNTTTNTCVCPPGTQWNNQFCTVIETCRGGMIWNQNTWTCECPSKSVWNGNYCIANPCLNGKVWDNNLKQCICVNDFQDVNGTCVPPQIYCTYGRIYNRVTFACECPPRTWDSGTSCDPIKTCTSNKIYNPLNNQCICSPGLVWLAAKNACGDPTCPIGQRWDGNGCVEISCPPNSYFNGTECICPDPRDLCLPWEFFNGKECVYYQDTCPQGTRWDGKSCISVGDCPEGFYKDGTTCKPLPQRCLPPTTYTGGKCVVGASCPFGTFKSGQSCQPYNKCENGQIWNTDMLQCVCPENTGWNGVQCVTCGGGQIWDLYEGCMCRKGYFFKGDKCELADRSRCLNIPNANWNIQQNLCICDPGFSIVGSQCICKGVPFEHFCDRCAHRPHSEYNFGVCQCKAGYTLYGTECLPNQNNGTDTAADCAVGTFFDSQQKKCLPCPDGCLTCSDCYTCQVCSPDFIYDPVSQLCIERCGDGKRYVLECDDGNNVDGDGCSVACQIEAGYDCRGGSPTSRDGCIVYNPSAVTMIQTGQIRYATKIVINIKLDYLPSELIQSIDCQDRCSQILDAKIVEGETAARVKSTFIAGSRYAFSVEFEFDRPYIAKFKAQILVKQSLGSRYFPGISISNPLEVEVNPAYLSLANSNQKDSLA